MCIVSSRDPIPLSTSGDLSDHTRLGVLTLTVLDPVMPVGSRDILLGIAKANEKCNSNALSLLYVQVINKVHLSDDLHPYLWTTLTLFHPAGNPKGSLPHPSCLRVLMERPCAAGWDSLPPLGASCSQQ